jgi:hypothetical protein
MSLSAALATIIAAAALVMEGSAATPKVDTDVAAA